MFSNHSIGLLVASSFTRVGLMRASIGPAIRVMLRGCAGLASAAITATAASAETHGWQTAITCAPGPMNSRKRMMCSVYSSSPNLPCSSADVARVVPIGDVDVILGQQCLHRAAQQCREVPRQRGDYQNARLLGARVLAEMEQGRERRDERRFFRDRDFLAPTIAVGSANSGRRWLSTVRDIKSHAAAQRRVIMLPVRPPEGPSASAVVRANARSGSSRSVWV